MRRRFFTFFVLLEFGTQSVALAADPASLNFQIQGASFVPVVAEGSSANFGVTTVIDPIVGLSDSPSWNIRHGAPVNDAAGSVPPPPSPTVVTGVPPPSPTAVGKVPVPTLIYNSPTFASHQVIRGLFPVGATGVWVNGSANGVKILSKNNWIRDLPLFLGVNQLQAQSVDAGGKRSVAVVGTIERMLIGDVNRSRHVDDVDLSLFTRAWKRYNPFADFNEDGKVDDVDLSLFASHWNLSY